MTSPSLIIETPAGTVRATARREADAVVFELTGAMRGHVHVTGTHHPHHWDQFTAVRACLGPVDAFQPTAGDNATASASALPRLARSRTGYRGSLTLYRDDTGLPAQTVYPMESTAGHQPSDKTAATLTAALRACAHQVQQRADLREILELSRERDTPALLRFLTWSTAHHHAQAARYEKWARAAGPERHAAVAAWWTVARLFTASPHPVLLMMLADLPHSVLPDSLARTVEVRQWWGPYCLTEAAGEYERARNAQAEADSLRAQQRTRARRSCAPDRAR